MKKLRVAICLIMSSLVLAAGCSDDSSSDSSSSIERAEFVNEFAEVVCARAFDCCAGDELQQILAEVGATTEAECRTNYATVLTSEFEPLLSAVDAGSLVYQPSQAGACLQAFSGLACSKGVLGTDEPPSAACDKVFVGNVPEGGECSESSECVAGGCIGIEYDENFDIATPGTCQPFIQNGEPCQSGQECAEGSTCNQEYDIDSGEFVGTCEAIRQLGESCDYGDCAFDAYCDLPADAQSGDLAGTCVAQKAAGEACEEYDECQSWTCEAPDGDPEGPKTCASDDESELTCSGK